MPHSEVRGQSWMSASPSILLETVFLVHGYVVRLANHLTPRFSCLSLPHQHRITGISVFRDPNSGLLRFRYVPHRLMC